MATYKEIHGVKVQYRDSDATAIEGDVWYNSSTGKLRMYASAGSWASGGAVPGTGLQGWPGSAGIQTAALVFAGITLINESGTYTNESYEYNGTAWGTDAGMNRDTGAYTQGCGTQTAAVSGGYYRTSPAGTLTVSESYNGSTWTETNATNNAIGVRTGCGTLTAALEAGGTNVTPTVSAVCETFDGSTWTEVNDLNTARSAAGQHNGTSTASLTIGGSTPSLVASVEEYNGTSWTETTDINTARKGQGGSGTTALALVYGGEVPAASALTESWDGTSWTELADLSTARAGGGSAGATNTSALQISGGLNPGYTTATEEWDVSASVETIAFD
jgi:hypothetical protein